MRLGKQRMKLYVTTWSYWRGSRSMVGRLEKEKKGKQKKNTEFGRVSEPQVWLFAGGCTKRRAAHLNNINVGSWTVMIWLRLKVGWCGGDQRFVNLRISVMEPVTLWVIHDEVECNEAESPRFIIYFYL